MDDFFAEYGSFLIETIIMFSLIIIVVSFASDPILIDFGGGVLS